MSIIFKACDLSGGKAVCTFYMSKCMYSYWPNDQFFSCWITFHFKEFQKCGGRKKIKIERTNCSFICQNIFCFWSNVISDT